MSTVPSSVVREHEFADDPRWQAVQNVISSKSFAKSTRLSAFLLYICEKTLRGCVDEITEQQIGVNVFGRPSDYNPGDDNIVRGVARQLRQRLALYYMEEGALEEVRIVVPRGAYIAEFESAPRPRNHQLDHSGEPAGYDSVRPPVAVPRATSSARGRTFLLAIGMFTLGALIMAAWTSYGPHPQPHVSKSSRLWISLFNPDKRTLIVAGDAGLNMLTNLARRNATIDEYTTGSFFRIPQSQTPRGYLWTPFPKRPYTSFADLSLVSKLVSLPEVVHSRMQVRFARDIHIDDLKSSNAILIGSANYNPWVDLYTGSSNFNFNLTWNGDTNLFTVTNKAPRPGEQATYHRVPKPDPDNNPGFVLIGFIDNAFGQNKVLLIQGTTLVGIDASIDFLFNENQIGPIIEQASNPDGTLRTFEVLLETNFINGNSQNTRVIATRIH